MLSRRQLLGASLAAPLFVASPAPALIRSGRPRLTHGLQVGDVTDGSATIWSRADRPSRLIVEWDARGGCHRRIAYATAESDLTAKVLVHGLPADCDIEYRVTPESLDGDEGKAQRGRFRTPARCRGDVNFVWSGDLAGQGWGIDRSRGGYRIFDAMRRLEPDFYICNGDGIYADGVLEPKVTLPDGSIWRNVTTEAKSKVAETVDEYRGNYKYNLLDDNLRRFYAEVAQIQQWDDHETLNNWYPGEILDDPAYTERRVDVLKQRSQRAWHEYNPITPRYDDDGRIYRVIHYGPDLDVFVLDMRWYRDANSANRQHFNNGGILGNRQAEWLKRELAHSRATWKVISNDMPLGILVADDDSYESVSQADPGLPLGRERQIADILHFLQRKGIGNVVWLTTDVHYTAAIHFDPARASYKHFDPFWQFVSGPLNAGSFPAGELDATFGPTWKYLKSPEIENASPATEFQFFGQVRIDGESGELRVDLRDNSGASLWSTTLTP